MIGVALLGAGFMGGVHAEAWRSLAGRARVVSVWSRSMARAEAVAAPLGARPTTDVESAIADADVDAVDVCLPTWCHREAAEAAFRHRRHALVEKPIALTLEDADAISVAADRAGCLLRVGHVLRFWPAYTRLRDEVAAGAIGAPTTVLTRRLSAPPSWAPWIRDQTSSGGVAVDLLVHDFDQANAILGEARSVEAWPVGTTGGAWPEHVLAHVEHVNGHAWVEGSLAMPPAYPFSTSIRVVGFAGVAEYDFRAAPTVGPGNVDAAASCEVGVELHLRTGESLRVSAEGRDAWAIQAEAFLDAIEGKRLSEAEAGTADQARAALSVALAANRSLTSGRAEAVSA